MPFHWFTHQYLDTLFLETHWSQKPGNKIFMADPDFLPFMNLLMLTPPSCNSHSTYNLQNLEAKSPLNPQCPTCEDIEDLSTKQFIVIT